MARIDENPTFTRPGVALIVFGVVALVLRLVLRNVPLIGGLLGLVLLLSAIFFIIGGAFLLIKNRS